MMTNILTFYKCIAQLFFFAFTNELQTLLVWMINVDRYCAIFWPYAYTAWVAKGNRGWQPAGLIVISSFLSQLPPTILITHASFCSQEVVINNALCLIGFVAEVACKGGALPSIYTFCVFLLVHILTAITVVHSSWRIVRVCRRTSSVDFRNKALHVCCTQVMVFGVKFCPVFGLAITSRVGLKNVYFRFIMYLALLIASPIANPIIYGLRTKEVREPVVRMWRKTVAQTRPFAIRKSEIQITKRWDMF
uniref:G-protein coupled receptors family 1 profile domain-containing protein n=1 Tax=Eptatretus burgeri TaxID=7764 RepID=A0A8C4NKZ8_EPTBU